MHLFIKRLFVALGWMAVCFGAGWLAPSRVSAVELDRTFLFLVDTSLSMSRIQGGARQAVYDLIFSGVQGRIKKGDHYTLWTFNERVNTRAFIPMNWDPALNRALATGASRFLGEQRLEKTTQIHKVIAELIPTAKTTDILTVFIISDGDDRMKGTAFDDEINFIYQRRARELQRARKPFVTTLVFRGGNLASWQVTAGGEDIPLPERNAEAPSPMIAPSMAPPLAPPATNAVVALATNKPSARPQTSLLIAPRVALLSNRVSSPVSTSSLLNPPPASAVSPPLTNQPALPSAPPQPAPRMSTTTSPAAVAVPVESLPQVMPAAAPTTNTRTAAATSSDAKALSPSPPSTAETPASKPTPSLTSPPTLASKPQGLETNATASTAPPARSLVSTPSAVMKPLTIVEPTVVTTSATQKTPLTASPATTTSLVTAPAPSPGVSPEGSEEASVKVPKLTNDSTIAKPSPKLPAVASKPEPPANRPWPILAVGSGFLGVAFCLGFFWLRRRRAPAPTSLISQSLDRDKK